MKLTIDFTSREALLGAKRELEIFLAKVEGGLAVFDQKNAASKAKIGEDVTSAFAEVFAALPNDFTSTEAIASAPNLTKTQVRNAIEQLIELGKIALVAKGMGRAPSKYQKIICMDDFEKAKQG